MKHNYLEDYRKFNRKKKQLTVLDLMSRNVAIP